VCLTNSDLVDRGFFDASLLAKCQMIFSEPSVENPVDLDAGTVCSDNNEDVRLGVFRDQHCALFDSDKRVENYIQDEEGRSLLLSYTRLQSAVSSEHSLPCTDIESFGQSGNPQLNDMCLRLQDEATACVSNEAVTSPQREGGEFISLLCSANSQNDKEGVINETASNLQRENSATMSLSSVLYVLCVSSFVLLILTA
jgi:hypothetical protein